MTHVIHRQLRAMPPVAVRGEGAYITDATGKRYLDASGGAAVSCLGHSDVRVIAAVKAQLDAIPYAHTGFFTNEPMEKLADFLAAAAPGDLDMVYFVSGGSEGMEAALKMACGVRSPTRRLRASASYAMMLPLLRSMIGW